MAKLSASQVTVLLFLLSLHMPFGLYTERETEVAPALGVSAKGNRLCKLSAYLNLHLLLLLFFIF